MHKQSFKLLMFAAFASFVVFTVPSFADSQARVVRLSDVQGDVLVDRNIGQGYEKAFLNLPITQGAKLQTSKNGRAEVEFEDGSTLRLIPDTVIDFPQLSLRDSGAKASAVHLLEGTAYIKFGGAKDDEFTLTFAHEKLSLTHAAHLRIEMGDTKATVSVFSGEAQVDGDSGTEVVAKNHSATFDLADKDHYALAKSVEPAAYDAWDKQQDQYQQDYAGKSSNSYSPNAYGASDLNYYGSFMNAPGYGTVWQPYFAGAGWDPFMNGAWAFTPGLGYGWVSGYPWGWTPYQYGSWLYLPQHGWAWQPGSTRTPWNAPRVINAPANFVMPQPPSSGQGTVMVNRGPMPILFGRSSNEIGMSKNSAGLGLPRGSVYNLGQVSHRVQQDGFATARLHSAPVGVPNWWRSGNSTPPRRMGTAGAMSTPSMAPHSSASAGHSGVRR
jgi:FecR protein